MQAEDELKRNVSVNVTLAFCVRLAKTINLILYQLIANKYNGLKCYSFSACLSF